MKKRVKDTSLTEVKEDHPIIKRKIKKSLKLSIKEGSFSSISTGFGSAYFGPFALFLGATAPQMSFLHGIAGIFPSISQLFSSHLMEKSSRKKITIVSSILTFIMLLMISFCGIFYFFDYTNIWVLLSLIGLFYIAFGLGQPSWFSWMGSLIPPERRGKYFSRRNKIAAIFGLIVMLATAVVLDYLKKIGIRTNQEMFYVGIGFVFLFIFAFITKLIATRMLVKQYEPRLTIRKKDRETFWKFLKNSNKTALGKFSWFNFFFRIAIGVSAPFYIIFLLKDLNFNYFTYMGFLVSGILFQISFLPILGKVSDRFGNIALVRSCSMALVLVPLSIFLSAFIPHRMIMISFILIVPQMFSGFGWAGINLATNNYLYDSTTPQKRGYALTNLNVLAGIGLFFGTLIAASIELLGINFLSISLTAFFLSTVLRVVVIFLGKHALEEVREVAPFSPTYFLHEIHPLRGTINQFHHITRPAGEVIHHI
jgi:MFS family permease